MELINHCGLTMINMRLRASKGHKMANNLQGYDQRKGNIAVDM